MSEAFRLSEQYYRNMYKWFAYPMVILTTLSATMATVQDVPGSMYIILGLNVSTLILAGLQQVISPQDKATRANQVSIEFGEIRDSILQFMAEHEKDDPNAVPFSQHIVSMLDVWRSLSPNIRDVFVQSAKSKLSSRPQTKLSPRRTQRRPLKHPASPKYSVKGIEHTFDHVVAGRGSDINIV
jgi:hypothetical protein